MKDESVRVLVVDDQADMADNLKKSITKEFAADKTPLEIVVCTSFDEAEALLEDELFDLAVLDVRLDASDIASEDPDRGRRLYERVCAVRWLPVVFYTAVPGQVRYLDAPPLVKVVSKSRPKDAVKAVRAGLGSGLPQFTRRVGAEMDQMLRRFLGDEVRPHWESMSDDDRRDIIPVLANRLSAFIRQGYLDEAHTALPSHASAARFYLYPPVSENLVTGDVLRVGGDWFVVLTPQCDLVIGENRPRKAQYLRVAPAVPVTSAGLGNNKDKVRAALTTNERYFLLPAFRLIPDLLVDFEQIQSLQFDDSRVTSAVRVATVDSPFCEAMLGRFGRYVSRIGFEDLPVADLVERAVTSSGA